MMNRFFVSLMGIVFLAGCSRPGNAPVADAENISDQLAKGAQVYEMTCAQCHYDGAGSPTAPDLRGSGVLQKTPADLAVLILKGQSGVSIMEGKKFNGVMPAQPHLTNEEIASVVIYVRDTFAQKRENLSPAIVAELR